LSLHGEFPGALPWPEGNHGRDPLRVTWVQPRGARRRDGRCVSLWSLRNRRGDRSWVDLVYRWLAKCAPERYAHGRSRGRPGTKGADPILNVGEARLATSTSSAGGSRETG